MQIVTKELQNRGNGQKSLRAIGKKCIIQWNLCMWQERVQRPLLWQNIGTEEIPMKKRAVLFLLVLCTVLCVALPAMADIIIASGDTDKEVQQKYEKANSENKTIRMQRTMAGENMLQDAWKLKTTMLFTSDMVFRPTGLHVTKSGTLGVYSDNPVIACDITNYGTIQSGFYTGTITNYGIIIGGTFSGTVINATDPTDDTKKGKVPVSETQTADLSRATLQIMDDDGNKSDGKNHASFDGAYVTVTLKLAEDEHIPADALRTKKILRGEKIWTDEPTRGGDPATTSTVFAYWQKEGSTGTNDVYAHDHFFCPGSQITVTPVWCDHVVKFDANQPASTVMLNDWMLPLPFYRNGGGKQLSANNFVCYQVDATGKLNGEKMWYLCWNANANRKGLNYAPASAEYTPDFNSGKQVTTMYARWGSICETGNGHTMSYQPYEKAPQTHDVTQQTYGGYYRLLDNMFDVDRGKEFEGWKIQNIDDPALFQPGDQILVVQQDSDDKEIKNRTYITARWRSLPVTEITFDVNGTGVIGTTGTANKETYYLNENLPLPQNGFTRQGFTFAGWNTRSDGTGTPYTDKQKISITGELAGDGAETKKVTLYAQWTPQPILIKQQPEDQSVMEGQSARFATDGFAPVPTTLSYQWQVDKGDGNGFVICPGETAATLDIAKTTAAQNGYRYRCVLSNGITSATTSAALLTVQVILPPKTGDPANSALWLALCLMSLGAMAALTLLRKQNLHRR